MASTPSLRPMGGAPDWPAGEPRRTLERGPYVLQPAAILALVLLTGLWVFWGWRKGAYFGTIFLPGLIVMCVGAALLIRFAPWRIRPRLSLPMVIAFSALTALGCWALLSALWSPAPDLAIGNGQRILGYAIAFGLGALLCNLLNARMNLVLAPAAIAGAGVGLITAFVMLASDPKTVLEADGTLQFPLGYRNAEAAFFAICLFPAITLAADRTLDWRLRAAALGTSTLCIDLAILAQSRASLPAVLVALIVFAVASPMRVRALSWLGLAALAAVPVIPAMSALFSASGDGIRDVGGQLHTAALITLFTTVAAVALGALAARNETRLPGLGRDSARGNRTVARGMIGLAVLAFVVFLVAAGNPFTWVGDRVDEFRNAGTPDLSAEGTRFGFNAGSNRYDAWRVALSDAGDDPLFGDGGGGYRYSYLQKRHAETQNIHDAHSVELEVLAEYGVVGLILLIGAVGGAFVGAYRSRPLGPTARLISAAALASGAYWLVHTSVDWFWPYPAITAPVMALLGSAAAPVTRVVGRRSTRPWRWWAIGALVVLALSTIAPYLSDLYINKSREELSSDPQVAIADLNRAHDLNPLDNFPLLRKGFIQSVTGDSQGALASYREAADLRPEDYASHYLIAQLEATRNPGLAQNEIRVALELNPLDAKVRQLATRLGIPKSELVPITQ